MAERTLTVKILGDATSAQRALGQLDNATGQTEGRFAKFGTVAKAAALAAGVAVIKFGKDSVDAFGESRKVSAQTEAVLKSTGGAAGVTSGQVGKLAEQLQKLSGVEDEAIQSGQNMLLTFTNIRNEAGAGNDIFNQATKAMLDMSVAMGTEAKTTAVQLGKALNDPIKGISALSRVGVTFTEEQKNTIRTMVEMGDKAGAQKLILAELNKEFGGSAKAAGDAQSPMERLSLRFGELQEKVGAKVVPALEKLTAIGLGTIDFLSNLSPQAQAAIGVLAGLAVAVLAINKAIAAWTAVQTALNAVLALNPIVLVGLAIAALVAGLILAYQKSETFRNIVDGAFRGVAAAAGFMKDVAVGAVQFLVDKFLAAVEWIVRGAAKAFGWVPFIGDDLKKAAGDIERFRDDVNRSLDGIQKKVEVSVRASLLWQDAQNTPAFMRRPVPKFHSGGIFHAPTPGGEGLALLRDKERVLPPGQSAGTTYIDNRTINISLDKYLGSRAELGRELVDILLAEERRNGARFAARS